ncbi:hypothetical protein QFZ49_003615 [Streptomyces turgidiscabies]|uniref:Uncharacterized protein n=1 Tax=Streptomyces turgidiscabies TaxID=85558 RepID=A0ABU0RRW1_9ACTN|nr:hypothetical protein [Streptomyces turgidiscabies]
MGLDRVGVLQLGVTDEFAARGQQEVRHARPGASAQLQPPLLGNGLLAVVVGGLREQFEDGFGLLGSEGDRGVDGTRQAGKDGGHGVVAGHGYEGKACPIHGESPEEATVP